MDKQWLTATRVLPCPWLVALKCRRALVLRSKSCMVTRRVFPPRSKSAAVSLRPGGFSAGSDANSKP